MQCSNREKDLSIFPGMGEGSGLPVNKMFHKSGLLSNEVEYIK